MSAITEIVERELVALALELGERRDHLVVEPFVLGDLKADQTRRNRLYKAAEDELARRVDPRGLVADDPAQLELGERVQHDRRGRLLGVVDDRVGGVAATAEQQLVTHDLELVVKDWLASDECGGH